MTKLHSSHLSKNITSRGREKRGGRERKRESGNGKSKENCQCWDTLMMSSLLILFRMTQNSPNRTSSAFTCISLAGIDLDVLGNCIL